MKLGVLLTVYIIRTWSKCLMECSKYG